MTNKKKKIKWKNVLLVLLLLIGIILTVISVFNLFIKKVENKKTLDTLDMINKKIKKKEVIDNDDTQVIENKEEEKKEESLYYKYIKMNMIDVDLNELKSINNDVVGWISVNGTNVNYPFVQTANNTYYLNHSFDKSKNSAGWVFLDYRNDIENIDKNTIIYAHGRNGNTMFGTLKNIFKSSWLNNNDNFREFRKCCVKGNFPFKI